MKEEIIEDGVVCALLGVERHCPVRVNAVRHGPGLVVEQDTHEVHPQLLHDDKVHVCRLVAKSSISPQPRDSAVLNSTSFCRLLFVAEIIVH